MSLVTIFQEGLKGSIGNVLQIAMIVIPFMIFVQIFKDLNLLDKLTSVVNPLTRFIGVSREGNLPILAGLVFGLGYGGGIIINSAREGKLSYRDIYLINLFLVICHSVFEETLLFVAIGAQWCPVLISRFVLAVVICSLWTRFAKTRDGRCLSYGK